MIRMAVLNQVGVTPGGAEQTLLTFLKHIPADIEPTAILFEDGEYAQRLRDLGIDVRITDLPPSIEQSSRERSSLGAALEMLPFARRIATILRSERVDIVYTNSMKAHLIGGVASKLAGLRCVMHFHDLISGVGLAALRTAARTTSHHRIACSRMVAKAIAVDKTTVIYAPIELDTFASLPDKAGALARLGLPRDLPTVAIIGRINRWKGHDRFIRIAARVNQIVPVRFVIVGSPIFRDFDFLPEIEELVRHYKLESRVNFVPWVDDVRDVYAAVDLNTNCSTREPLGRTILEAAAAGIPTVCFDDSGASETILNGMAGTVVPAGDEKHFADAIIRYMHHPAKRIAAGSAAREGMRRYAAQPIAEEMAAIVRNACG